MKSEVQEGLQKNVRWKWDWPEVTYGKRSQGNRIHKERYIQWRDFKRPEKTVEVVLYTWCRGSCLDRYVSSTSYLQKTYLFTYVLSWLVRFISHSSFRNESIEILKMKKNLNLSSGKTKNDVKLTGWWFFLFPIGTLIDKRGIRESGYGRP